MDLQSFTLGIVSVVISVIIGVVIYTFFRVQKQYRTIKSIFEDMRAIHSDLNGNINEKTDNLSRIIAQDRQETMQNSENTYRDIQKVKDDISKAYTEMSNFVNHRFDKFENRLNTSCFKNSDDDKLYS
jgi:sensor domain CHASE-containing protein